MPRFAAELRGRDARGFISRALEEGIMDRSVRIIHTDGKVVVPLLSAPSFISSNIIVRGAEQFSWKPRLKRSSLSYHHPSIRDPSLPHRWERIGASLIVKLPEELKTHDVGRAYAEAAGAKSVYAVDGRISGIYRKPSMRLLYGPGGETVHHENGVNYVLDVAQVMFSSANHDERMRMSSVGQRGEVVADMFAGIGHLSMPIAVHCSPSKVYAAEPDAVTYSYLLKTVAANSVQHIYQCFQGPNELLRLSECDRVILGYLHGTREWLDRAISMCRIGGVIHLHEIVERGKELEWAGRIQSEYPSVRPILCRRVKGYSATHTHMVLDLEVTGRP